MQETWVFTKQILPYLFVGVFLAGLITVLLPPNAVAKLVGGNAVTSNAVAAVSGALMYFATLTEIPILQALTLVRDIIGNREIARSLERVNNRVKEGDRLSKALNDLNLFPSLAVQMITVGEETGRLDAMLLRVAENYEKIVRDAVKRFINLLEPAMILVMGVIVGLIVISMLTAIFSMNDMPF